MTSLLRQCEDLGSGDEKDRGRQSVQLGEMGPAPPDNGWRYSGQLSSGSGLWLKTW